MRFFKKDDIWAPMSCAEGTYIKPAKGTKEEEFGKGKRFIQYVTVKWLGDPYNSPLTVRLVTLGSSSHVAYGVRIRGPFKRSEPRDSVPDGTNVSGRKKWALDLESSKFARGYKP